MYTSSMETEYFIISMIVDYSPPLYVNIAGITPKFTPHKSEALIFSDTSHFYEVLLTYNSPGRTIAMLGVQMPDVEKMVYL